MRPYEAADAPAVTALWAAVFPDERPWNQPEAILRRKIVLGDGFVWVAEADGIVVGTVMAGWDGQRGWLYHLATAPPHRRRGIGRALVRAAEEALVARGCPKVNLQVVAANRDVAAFYARLGYVVEDRISMGKTLARG